MKKFLILLSLPMLANASSLFDSGPGFFSLPDLRNQSRSLTTGPVGLAQETRKFINYEYTHYNIYQKADSTGYDSKTDYKDHELKGMYHFDNSVLAISHEIISGDYDSENLAVPQSYSGDIDFNISKLAFAHKFDNFLIGVQQLIGNSKYHAAGSATTSKLSALMTEVGVGYVLDKMVFSYAAYFNQEKDKDYDLKLTYISHSIGFGYHVNNDLMFEAVLNHEPAKKKTDGTNSLTNSKSTDLAFNALFKKDYYELYAYTLFGKGESYDKKTKTTDFSLGLAPEVRLAEIFYASFRPSFNRTLDDEAGTQTVDAEQKYQMIVGLRKDQYDVGIGYQKSFITDEDETSGVTEVTKSQNNIYNVSFLWKF